MPTMNRSVEIVRPRQIGDLRDNHSMRGFVCVTCRKTMFKHWILPFKDEKQQKKYWCYVDGTSFSQKWAQ